MLRKLKQVDVFANGVGIDTETSEQPTPGQRIRLHYMQWYTYFASPDDLLQVDTYGATAVERKTLFYVNPSAAVHYAPGAVMLDLPLNPGEYFQAYVKGAGATSSVSIVIWYSIEDVSDVTYSMELPQAQQCDPWSRLMGRC